MTAPGVVSALLAYAAGDPRLRGNILTVYVHVVNNADETVGFCEKQDATARALGLDRGDVSRFLLKLVEWQYLSPVGRSRYARQYRVVLPPGDARRVTPRVPHFHTA